MALTQCSNCGYVFDSGKLEGFPSPECPKCMKLSASAYTPTGEGVNSQNTYSGYPENDYVPPPTTEKHIITFEGRAGEYFSIWIVNLLLTIITFGVYSAWAKVRTKKFFYKNTRIANNSFDYLGPPAAILRGRLIIGLAFLLFLVAQHFRLPLLYGIIMVIFFTVLPFLIYKSLRFRMHYTTYRNIRFRFLGTLEESYKVNLFYNFLMPLTAGLIYPYIEFRKKKYYFGNFAFGKTLAKFTGRPGPFYKYYFIVAFAVIGFYFLFIFFLRYIFLTIKVMSNAMPVGAQEGLFSLVMLFVLYGFFFLVFTTIKLFLFVKLTNYSLGETQIGGVEFSSGLSFPSLLWIGITNIIAIICSAGLLYPWAKVRYTRYLLKHIVLFVEGGFGSFTAAEEPEKSAMGDAAADFFDFEIGL